MLKWLTTPQAHLHYPFILYMYLGASVICAILATLDLVLQIETAKGFWIIFAPFLPCLIWAFFMNRKAKQQLLREANNSAANEERSEDSKKQR